MYTNKCHFCSVDELGIYASLVGIRISYAVLGVLMGNELSKGVNPLVFIVYSYGVAALVLAPLAFFLEKKKRPITVNLPMFGQFFLLSIGGVCAFQSLLLMGLKDTSPAFASAMPNLAPAIIFVMAWASGMEKVNMMCTRSKAKIVGTLICVCGAMAMSFLQGPALSELWSVVTRSNSIYDPDTVHPVENILVSFYHEEKGNSSRQIRGCIYLISAVMILSATMILQAETLKKYPALLSQTSITGILGSIQTAVLMIILDRGINPTSWLLDRSEILTIIFGGIICNGVAFALQLWCMQKRGPVFVTIFSPVSTVCSAVLSSLFLGNRLHLGSVMGVLLIFVGLYLVLWGKSQDSVTQMEISSGNELHIEEEEQLHHPSLPEVLDVKIPLLY